MDRNPAEENELVQFLDSTSDAQVRNCNAVLLLPFDRILSLLDIELAEMWRAVREVRKGLPTFKTAQKLYVKEPQQPSMASFKKHLGALPVPRRTIQMLRHQFEKGYSTPETCHWLSFLEHTDSIHPAVTAYWEEKLYQVSDFSGIELRSHPTRIERCFAYNGSEIVRLLGCSKARELMPVTLSNLQFDEEVESSKELSNTFAADAFSTLLRLAAWLIAEAQVNNWEWEVSENSHNSIHAAWVIPRWCSSTSTWSNPMEHALERLAKAAGWSGKKQNPVTFLGKVWAEAEDMDPASRIRLLRNWQQLKPSRPSFKKLLELVQLCFDLHIQTRDDLPDGVEAAYWQGACWFRFAETMAIIVRDARKAGWPNDLITSMLGVYESEYRVARELLGKPIQG